MSKKSLDYKKYEEYLAEIQKTLDINYDVKYRKINTDNGEITLIYIDSITNQEFIAKHITAPIMKAENLPNDVELIKNRIITTNDIGDIKDPQHAVKEILFGNAIILFSFGQQVLYTEVKSYSKRGIEEPPAETVLKGPREGFTENLQDNISLIRRRIRSPRLKIEKYLMGDVSETALAVIYIEDIAPKEVVDFVRKRVKSIHTGFLLEGKYVDKSLQTKESAFDTIGNTEKPDIMVAKITEGRVAILVDNNPFAITAPHFFVEYFHTPDDYYLNKYGQNFFRLIRWGAFLISLLLPGFYLSLITYHFKLIPYIFTFRMAVTRAGVPFPAIIEIIIMMFFFQILREAGIRLPQPIGSALSIVGALILGDAAIGAGLTSQITVLIIALSSISLFLVPKMYGAVVIWSNMILIFSALLGLPGFYIGFILFVSHIAGLDTCGYPYLFPMGTYKTLNFGDLILRDNLNRISKNILQEDEQDEKN